MDATSAATTLARMDSIFALQQESCARLPMPSLDQRRQQLTLLKTLLIEHKDAIAAAINADFTARSVDETMLAEIMPCVQSIEHTLKHLRGWMKPDKRSVGLHFMPASARVAYQPLGVVGIIVPFNYPLNLTIVPLVTALAAGNRAMIKMSEFTPRTADLLRDMLRKGFAEDQVAVVTGEADIAAAFSRIPFDHLLFTGSTAIGKHVMRAAAENLTPVTLELGGKSPAIIADDIPLADIIDRLCFAKSLNAGQTCVAPDYVLIPRGKLEAFMQLYKSTFNRMFPTLNGNPHYTSVINAHTLQRLQDWLKDAAAKGARIEKTSDESISDGTFRMPLHLVTDVSDEMKIMQHELFGPILPVIPYDNIEAALAYVRQRPRPLSLYLFTYDSALQEQVTTHTHAGAMCINDALIQVGVDDLPFGGIGQSGMGHYHGHEGFLTMSKAKAIMRKGRLNSMKLIYPPYGGMVQKWMMKWLTRCCVSVSLMLLHNTPLKKQGACWAN
jgi:coniferyl-aldehyde dehydrogenase